MSTSLTQKFSPSLADLLSADDLPELLDFAGEAVDELLAGLYYTDYRFYRSPRGDRGFYSLNVHLYRTLTLFSVPGTDLAVVLNPADDAGAVAGSSFAVSASYELEILRYLADFDLATFDFSVDGSLDLLSAVFDLADEDLVRATIETFLGDPDDPEVGQDPLQDFVDAYNGAYAPQITSSTDLADVVAQIGAHHEVAEIVLDLYVEGDFENLRAVLARVAGDVSYDHLVSLVTPRVQASVTDVSLAIEFPRELLQPLDDDGNLLDEPAVSRLVFDAGALVFDSETGIRFDPEASFSLAKSGILHTGLTLEIEDLRLFLTPGQCFYEGSAVDAYEDFTGVFVGEATVGLPAFWSADESASTAEIRAKNMLLGTGGVSGTVELRATEDGDESPLLSTRLGGEDGFRLDLDRFDLTFEQSAVTASNIHGSLTIPGFENADGDPAEIEVDVSISPDGFEVTATTDAELELAVPEVFTLSLDSLSVGSSDDRWYVEVAGTLEITAEVPGVGGPLLPGAIEIRGLRIYSDGSFELDGGSLVLNEAMSLAAGPVEIAVTAIHFGSHEQEYDGESRKYAYFGFDGGLSLDPGGVDARGDGIKLYFTTDHLADDSKSLDLFLKIESIAIDLTIPGEASAETAVLLLSGYLSMKNPDPDVADSVAGTDYSGAIAFAIPPIQMAGSAAMRLNPDTPAFLVDLGLELAVPLPLGTTGLGIYGFRGLVGSNYVASKSAAELDDDASWYDYYKAKVSPDYSEGVQLGKFEQTDGFSLGAGVSLATAPDAGRAFSSKLFFLASLPEVLLLQGQAALLAQRVGLDVTDDPPFSALIVLSSTSIEAGFGVDYSVPDGGEILDVSGSAEMGFFFDDASAWYVNLGRDTPEEKRIQATVVTLFEGYAYLMLSSGGIQAGAGASWDFSKKYGPAEVALGAYLDTGGEISFKPLQVGGFIALGGYAYVAVYKFKLGFNVEASLAAEAPRPFIVTGSFTLVIDIPKPFKDLEIDVELTWTFENQRNTDEIEFLDVSDLATRSPVQALNVLTGESFPLAYLGTGSSLSDPGDWDDYVIPLDSYIDVEFNKYVKPDESGDTLDRYGGISGSPSYTELVPPQKGKSEQVKHEFHVRNVYLKYWDGAWQDYDVYEAITPLADLDGIAEEDLEDRTFGYWQLADGSDRYNKLRILSMTPISWATSGSGGRTLENFGFTVEDVTCPEDEIEEVCVDWEGVPADTSYPPDRTWFYEDLFFSVSPEEARVQALPNAFGLRHGLMVQEGSRLAVTFREPIDSVTLRLTTLADAVIVGFHRREEVERPGARAPVYAYRQVGEAILDPVDLLHPVVSPVDEPFDRVTVESGDCVGESGTIPGYLNTVCEFRARALGPLVIDCRRARREVRRLEKEWKDHCPMDRQKRALLRDRLERAREARREACGALDDLRSFLNLVCTGAFANLPTPYRCATYVHQICYLTVAAAEHNENVQDLDEKVDDVNAMVEAMETLLHPVWRPNTRFAVQVQTEDVVDGTSKGERWYSFGFRTEGPVGWFHQFRNEYQALAAEDRASDFRLASLKHYLDTTTSYPDPEGRLTGAKPLFYEKVSLTLFYKHDYVYMFYSDWDALGALDPVASSLEIVIKDPTDQTAERSTLTRVALLDWVEHSNPTVSQELSTMDNLLSQGENCSERSPRGFPGILSRSEPEDLEPEKLYTALCVSRFTDRDGTDRENIVHEYVFRTSRYASFEEQVESFTLADADGHEAEALFRVELSVDDARLASARAIVEGTLSESDSLVGEYADTLDRLLFGALEMESLPAAVSTELDVLVREESGEVLGILVRGPEPFNDPRLPESVLPDALEVSHRDAGGDYTVLWSRDLSTALITNDAMSIPVGTVDLTFRYFTYDGSDYVVGDPSTDEVTLSPEVEA